MAKVKYYVVWEGKQPGIYRSWEEAKEQVDGCKGARYKSFTSLQDATEAFRKGSDDNLEAIATLLIQARENAAATPPPPVRTLHPAVDRTAIAVDASCLGNPGRMEYRGVELAGGKEIFRVGPFDDATNNVGEYLALVHVLALCKKRGLNRTIYSDSKTALSWLRRRQSRSTLAPTPRNKELLALLKRADAWVAANNWPNRVLKWNTEEWGEIPADFNRK